MFGWFAGGVVVGEKLVTNWWVELDESRNVSKWAP